MGEEKMDFFKIDSHKLMYHADRVADWLKGKEIFPIYVEVGIFGGCNHRCIFCAFDFLKYKPDVLEMKYIKRFVFQAAKEGVKAILYSGEGEPLMHKDIINIISYTKKSGLDVALVTNGVMLNREISERILNNLSWIKVSLDAGIKNTYALIHGTVKEDFNKVLDNLVQAVRIKKRNKNNCSIGVQSLLIPSNINEMVKLAGILRDIGVDYLVIKPYCPHVLSKNKISFSLSLESLYFLEKRLEKYSSKAFKVILRKNALSKFNKIKPYNSCLGLSFAAHISADGKVYPCNAFVGINKYSYGSIKENKFPDIWLGRRRQKIIDMLYSQVDVNKCRGACRFDEINRYLWDIKHPVPHVNFI